MNRLDALIDALREWAVNHDHAPLAFALDDLPSDDEEDFEVQLPMQPLAAALDAFERDYLLQALARSNRKRVEAAKLLGISRKNLWEKLKTHGIPSRYKAK